MELALMTGWFAANYVWRKELPELSSELQKLRETGKPQTAEEALFVLEAISARLGIPIETTPPKTRA